MRNFGSRTQRERGEAGEHERRAGHRGGARALAQNDKPSAIAVTGSASVSVAALARADATEHRARTGQ